MDISGGGRSPFSPRVRALATGFAGRRGLPLSAAKKTLTSKMGAAARGPPGDLILKTQSSSIESHGLPLPVLVTETLTFANAKDVSVRLSPDGWCWLVCARKLLVWPYRDGKASSCRELTLPQTDLAHKAGLVCVFYDENNQMPSCIGASPEGTVRYWPSVAHETAYVDETAELQGQECDSLTDVMPVGCVLATTTCTIVLVETAHTDGRPAIVTRTLRAPSGWLGGLGRRVSLLIFGSMPAQMVETKLVGVSVMETLTLTNEEGVQESTGPYVACVAAGPCLQLWKLPGDGGERLVRELELRRPLREAYCRHQLFPQADIGTLDVYVLDLQSSNNGLLLLTAAVNPTRSNDIRYAFVQLSLEENPRSRVTSLVPLQRLGLQRDEGDTEPLPLRFLESSTRAYLYTRRQLIILSSTIANDKLDYIDLNSEGDRILGAELCHGLPILFTKNNGIIAVIPNDYTSNDASICESPLGSPCPSDMYDGHLSLYEIDPHEHTYITAGIVQKLRVAQRAMERAMLEISLRDKISQVTTDAQGKLKTAFLYHVRRDAVACRAIIEELFPARTCIPPPQSPARWNASAGMLAGISEEEEQDVDAALDRTVVRIAKEMLDDVPAGDPRWNTSVSSDGVNIPLGSSSALQIGTQLRDKQKALDLLIDFLRATGLWHRLAFISRELGYLPATASSGIVSSRSFLGQLLERLAAAIALRRMQQGAFAHIIDTAIHQVIHREPGSESHETEQALSGRTLSPSDVFYKRVSGVERALHAIVRWCEEQASSDAAVDSLTRLLLDANKVLLGVLQEVHKCRNQNSSCLDLPTLSSGNVAHAVTWTGAVGSKALLTVLAKQQKLTIVHGARQCADATLRGQLYDQAVALAETLLTDAAYLSRSPSTQHLYETMRHDLIKPFVDDDQYERASVLAEKFKDFEMLIVMCSKTEDIDKLHEYMDKYATEGLIEQTFAWLVESGGAGAVRMLRSLGVRYCGRLRAWLGASVLRHELLWLHELQAENWQNAAAVSATLAQAETGSVEKMMTMASLSKLCALAADDGWRERDEVSMCAERCLTLAEQHAALPRELLLRHGLDGADGMRVFTPRDLIQMYTTDNIGLTEYDFKKALDLAEHIDDDKERSAMRLKVWCAAILQDEWSEYSPDAPLDAVQQKTFFKLVDLAELLGCSLEETLPSLEELLTAEPLAQLTNNTAFQFILRYGYEHLRHSHDNSIGADSS